MTGNELRQKYLDFFRGKDSLVLPSSSLIPSDPTTLLTSAGMQPLVPFFKGEETPPATRLASCQKCCRADDIERVGVTWRHASFFEMLGNFSFGDYFKREAIMWGWEFLTKDLNIDPDLLWVSVYHEDTDAPEFWKKDVGLSDDRIYRFGKADNWWGPVGRTGPCGPDSEIFFDRGPKYDTGDPEMDRPGGEGDRYGELWNLVFQQYNQQEDGELLPLPAPGIDTGMGLERTAAVLQGVDTIHHCDLFAPIIRAIDEARHGDLTYSTLPLPLHPDDPETRPLKVIADHLRAAVFMLSDGINPGRNGREYMLRRFIRRAYLLGRKLGYEEPFLYRIAPVVRRVYGHEYREIMIREQSIYDLIRREEERFSDTLDAGMTRLEGLIDTERKKGKTVLPGDEVFRLYETYGFPSELTTEIASEQGFTIDNEGYHIAAEHHSISSGSSVGEYEKRLFRRPELDTDFVDSQECRVRVIDFIGLGIETQGRPYFYYVVLNQTPFHPAVNNGEPGDSGELLGDGFKARVVETHKHLNTWLHKVQVIEGELKKDLIVRAIVKQPEERKLQNVGPVDNESAELLLKKKLETDFTGYDQLSSEAMVVDFEVEVHEDNRVNVYLVLDQTPFYAESGGQIGDTGEILGIDDDFSAKVVDTQKQGKTWVHSIKINRGKLRKGLKVQAVVDGSRRRAIERAHSATHILHAALRQHLGKHVEQRGSLVLPDRLRFDFVHYAPITAEEMKQVEDTLNEHILSSDPVKISYASQAEARAAGAMALFGEKYGDVVRTVRMGDFSLELCGGTHLPTTSAAGLCRIVSESGVGSNLRRVEALTGVAALEHDRQLDQRLRETAGHLGAQADDVANAAEKLRRRVRELEKQLLQAQQKMAGSAVDELLGQASEINGVKFAAVRAPEGLNVNAMRDLADRLTDKLGGVVALAAAGDGKVLWAVKAAPAAVARGAHAGNLVRELAKITGGGGGGRPEFAQAGGSIPGKIDEALGQVEELLGKQLN